MGEKGGNVSVEVGGRRSEGAPEKGRKKNPVEEIKKRSIAGSAIPIRFVSFARVSSNRFRRFLQGARALKEDLRSRVVQTAE